MYNIFLVCLVPLVNSFPQFGGYRRETSFGNNGNYYPRGSFGTITISAGDAYATNSVIKPPSTTGGETESKGFGFGSVPNSEIRNQLCPGIIGPTENIRYDRKTKKCYEIGKKGPCSENMIFYGVSYNDVYGECDCSYSTIPKPLVYHPETKKCYFIYEQAYCRQKDEWLAFNRQGMPECSQNICKNPNQIQSQVSSPSVPLHGDGPCVELNRPSTECEQGEVVAFIPDVLTPQCVKDRLLTRTLSLTRKLECRRGTFLSFSGSCASPYVW